ncbi:MAG TPA: SH3 domain-containing protein [Pseudorhizobium sp.]|nr:SH3 domain-containing protein [Pseudorhizobium sp.]
MVNVPPSDVLNVRRQPNANSTIVNRLSYNSCGVIVAGECVGNWCPVEARHDTGWVHRRYISMISPALYCVANVASADRLSLRKWPSPQSQILTRLPHNQCNIAFLPYATNGWQKIRVDGWEGWVNRHFVSGQ